MQNLLDKKQVSARDGKLIESYVKIGLIKNPKKWAKKPNIPKNCPKNPVSGFGVFANGKTLCEQLNFNKSPRRVTFFMVKD